MPLNDPESRDARGQNFPADLCNYAHILGSRTTKFGKEGEGVFVGVSHAPSHAAGPQRPKFFFANADARMVANCLVRLRSSIRKSVIEYRSEIICDICSCAVIDIYSREETLC